MGYESTGREISFFFAWGASLELRLCRDRRWWISDDTGLVKPERRQPLAPSNAGLIQLDDLALPRLPMPLKVFNLMPERLARRTLSFNAKSLLEGACRRARLQDFGDQSFLEPMNVLLESIEGENESTPLGRFLTRELILGLLVTRLRLEELEKRFPEILDEEVTAPIIIAGLPRTGTTHLHNLLSSEPLFRSMPYWEGLEPIPDIDHVLQSRKTDPRVQRCAQGLKLIHYAMPHFSAMHEITPESKHEEIQLLAADFRSMLFEVSYWIPSYGKWYEETDQRPGYRFLRRILKAMQWLRGPRRWLLKSPQHIEQLGPLLEVFPDAKIIQTHRDPVKIVASFATMVAYGQRMQRAQVERRAVGEYWAGRIERMLRATVRDQSLLRADQILHVHLEELKADSLRAVEEVHRFIGIDLDEPSRRAVIGYRNQNPLGKHGRINYRLDDLGLDEEKLAEQLRFYSQRFGVSRESPRRAVA